LVQEPTQWNLDDLTITDDTRLLRRISKNQGVYRPPGGASRPASGAFKARPGELSVYVESVLRELGLSFQDVLNGHEAGYLLVAVTSGQVRALRLGVVRDPDLTSGPLGPAHALITGKLNQAALNTLTRDCEKVVWE
jgi:hypothetical protein